MSAVGETAILVHGFTMRDVERFTQRAMAASSRYAYTMSRSDRWDAAWFAIVELLYASEEPPTDDDCVWAGVEAVAQEGKGGLRHHGFGPKGPMPSFNKYWLPASGHHTDFTEALAERMALPQALALLSPRQYEAVAAVAVHATQQQAADSLGIALKTLTYHLRRARRQIAEAWLAGETPREKPDEDTCRSLHPRREFGYKDPRGWWRCRACRNRVNSKSRRRVNPNLTVEKSLPQP